MYELRSLPANAGEPIESHYEFIPLVMSLCLRERCDEFVVKVTNLNRIELTSTSGKFKFEIKHIN